VLTLDPVKEALADVLGLGDEDWSNRVGDAAAEVVFRQAASFPDAIAEGWWRGARRDRALAEFATRPRCSATAIPGWRRTGRRTGSATAGIPSTAT